MPKILLEPDDFDALHFSFLAHGGVGGVTPFVHGSDTTVPHCALGHAAWLDGFDRGSTEEVQKTDFGIRLAEAGLTWEKNDDALQEHFKGPIYGSKIDFETYISLLNIDIKE